MTWKICRPRQSFTSFAKVYFFFFLRIVVATSSFLSSWLFESPAASGVERSKSIAGAYQLAKEFCFCFETQTEGQIGQLWLCYGNSWIVNPVSSLFTLDSVSTCERKWATCWTVRQPLWKKKERIEFTIKRKKKGTFCYLCVSNPTNFCTRVPMVIPQSIFS